MIDEKFIEVIEMILDEKTDEYFDLKNQDEHLNPDGCENCNGHFGWHPEEGYLFECCDCQNYYSSRKEALEKLNAQIEVLTEILIDYKED